VLATAVLVDDSPELRALVRTQLRLSGRFAVVGEGGTGADAIALAQQHRPTLMLLDVSMPGMDGLEALPAVLAESPETSVVLFSGFEDRGLSERGRALGALSLVAKSTPLDELADTLEALVDAPAERDGAPPGRAELSVAMRPAAEAAPVLDAQATGFHEVFDRASIGMATLTLTGTVVGVNRRLAALLGKQSEDAVGAPYADVTSASTSEAAEISRAVTALAAGQADAVAVEHRVSGGASRHLVVSTFTSVRGDRDQPLYLFVQTREVAAQHAAAEEPWQSEERLRLLVEAVEDYAIFMLDPEGRVASWNAGAQRAKGYAAEDILGEHFRRFYPLDQQQSGHPERELELALRDGRYEEEGWRVRQDGSTFWANVVITAVHDADRQHIGFAKVTRDITERREATLQRERAAAALSVAKDELEKMNSRLVQAAADQSAFLAVTAHELRGPVGVLGGSAKTLAQHWADLTDEERSDLFEGMTTSSGRLRRLLGDLLMAARLDAGAVELQRRPVPVADVLAAAASAVRLAHPGLEIVVDAPADEEVYADLDRSAQVLENLLSNSLQHGVPPVRVSAVAVDGQVVIRVSDAGPGVSPHMQDRLFSRFATGERKSGTGLGLFIVRELARAQGGEAWYEPAADGRAAAFAVSLPQPREVAT
jgi:PAS domain S-box-containing protein